MRISMNLIITYSLTVIKFVYHSRARAVVRRQNLSKPWEKYINDNKFKRFIFSSGAYFFKYARVTLSSLVGGFYSHSTGWYNFVGFRPISILKAVITINNSRVRVVRQTHTKTRRILIILNYPRRRLLFARRITGHGHNYLGAELTSRSVYIHKHTHAYHDML